MTRGTVKVRLRPIKLAFLVHPNDKESLLKAIEINTFLWGGMYNPILPTYKRIPPNWERLPAKNQTTKSIVSGYLDNFDPDYVVPMGECVDYDLDIGYRQRINDVSEVLASVEENGAPNYGVGLFEVLKYFFEEELKFQRRYPLDICIPCFGIRLHLFLASVLGKLPKNIDSVFWKRFAEHFDAKKINFTVSNYTEVLEPNKLFLRRITDLYLERRGRQKQCIFYLDATKILDIIDYWNLRAIGWNVIPIPKQFVKVDKTKQFIQNVIEANHVPHHSNPEIYHNTTILKSRSISEIEHQQFSDTIDFSRSDDSHRNPKLGLQTWYPRMWNEWARGPDHVECCELIAEVDEHDISPNEETIHLKTLDPKFVSIDFAGLDASRFANEIDLRLYGDKKLRAEVIPEAEVGLARVIDQFHFVDWRISRKGLVYLSRHSENTITLSLPEAEDIFTRWMKLKGWTVELSSAGHIAKQMILQLGGVSGTWILAQEGIIQLLGKMSSSNEILSELLKRISDLQKLLGQNEFQTAENEVEVFEKYLKEIQLQLGGDEKSMSEEFVRGEIQKIVNQMGYKIDGSVERILQQLIEAKVFQLGIEIQCPICTKHLWHSVKAADYELQCPTCLAFFPFPHASKEVNWSYRTLGPFSLPKHAHGAYTVLLTLRFFSDFSRLNGTTTPLMSFTAKKDGMNLLEADLGMFYQESKFRNSKTEVIFAECKTFNSFRKKDVNKMINLGDAFPGAILVFAKLDENLRDEEKTILCTLADQSRINRMKNFPFNPILILTGKELFWKSDFSEWWNKRGGMRMAVNSREGMLELCDFTQQINLGMDSWHQWLDKQYGIEDRPNRAAHTTWTTRTN